MLNLNLCTAHCTCLPTTSAFLSFQHVLMRTHPTAYLEALAKRHTIKSLVPFFYLQKENRQLLFMDLFSCLGMNAKTKKTCFQRIKNIKKTHFQRIKASAAHMGRALPSPHGAIFRI